MSTIASTIISTATAHSVTRTSDFVRACSAIAQPHSVRARLHYLAAQGVIARVAKGMYVAKSGETMQVGFQADSRVACAELAAAGCKVDAIFLDVPYGAGEEGQGVKGGNRDLAAFPVIHSTEFAKMAKDMARMLDADAPAVLIMSNGKSSTKAKAGYIAAMEAAGFKLSAVGEYTKTYANGAPVQFMGRTMPNEGIFVFTKSGRAIAADLSISAVRPSAGCYPTQKPLQLLDRIVSELSTVGATWLDPFAGSGSLYKSCSSLGRNGLYIDVLHNPVTYN